MGKRAIAASLIVTVSSGLFAVAWMLLGWPPPRYVLRYGLTPGCEPTGKTRTVEGVTFVEIGPGCFRMGSHFTCEEGDLLGRLCAPIGISWGKHPKHGAECPTHWVEFRGGFWIARTELTNEQYERFDPKHERGGEPVRLGPLRPVLLNLPGGSHPVENVSWMDAKLYCAWLANRSGLPVRLPSEAEWEAASRAGSRREYCFGDEEEDLVKYAWFKANSGGRVHEVARRLPNAWGLHDFHGNVWEWCEDTWHESFEGGPSNGSAWTEEGTQSVGASSPPRIYRGGCWCNPARVCRSAERNFIVPGSLGPGGGIGFRPVLARVNE